VKLQGLQIEVQASTGKEDTNEDIYLAHSHHTYQNPIKTLDDLRKNFQSLQRKLQQLSSKNEHLLNEIQGAAAGEAAATIALQRALNRQNPNSGVKIEPRIKRERGVDDENPESRRARVRAVLDAGTEVVALD